MKVAGSASPEVGLKFSKRDVYLHARQIYLIGEARQNCLKLKRSVNFTKTSRRT
jgi:hypothetical protein